jgi:hypothetical protein
MNMKEIKMTEPTNFKITWGDEETVIDGRTEAVEFAKAKSADVPMNVSVESVDEDASSTISMTYNGGSLEVYVAETKSADRRSRKKDRNDEDGNSSSDAASTDAASTDAASTEGESAEATSTDVAIADAASSDTASADAASADAASAD